MAYEVFRCVTQFMLLQLSQVCSTYMACSLESEMACSAYQSGHLFDDTSLMAECLQVIKRNIQQVLNHTSFYESTMDTVATIFGIEDLQIDSELELFDALERYVEEDTKSRKRICGLAECEAGGKKIKLENGEALAIESSIMRPDKMQNDIKQNEINTFASVTQSNKPPKEIIPALQQIRFLTLTAKEFASRIARSTLLSQDQVFAILMNLAGANVPMPEGFSINKQIRFKRPVTPQQPLNSTTLTLVIIPPKDSNSCLPHQMSPPVSLRGRMWKVKAVPRYKMRVNYSVYVRYMDIYLLCADPLPAPWTCAVRAEFRVLAQKDGVPDIIRTMVQNFDSTHNCHGYTRLVKLDTISDYTRQPENEIVVKIDVTVGEITTKT